MDLFTIFAIGEVLFNIFDKRIGTSPGIGIDSQFRKRGDVGHFHVGRRSIFGEHGLIF